MLDIEVVLILTGWLTVLEVETSDVVNVVVDVVVDNVVIVVVDVVVDVVVGGVVVSCAFLNKNSFSKYFNFN